MACNLTGKKSSGDAKNLFKKGRPSACPFLIVAYIPTLGKIVPNMPKFGTKSHSIELFSS